MKKIKEILFSTNTLFYRSMWFIVFFLMWVTVYANNFSWGAINDDANTTGNDRWSLTWSIGVVDIHDTRYAAWLRWEMSGIIESELFWNFSFSDFKMNDIWSSSCSIGNTYNITGTMVSYYFWPMSIVWGSYFCPETLDVVLRAYSDSLWFKYILNNLSGMIVPYNIFDKQQIAINWISSIEWDVKNLLWSDNKKILWVSTDSALGVFKNFIIDKNIEAITRNIAPDTTTLQLDEIHNNSWEEKIYYYDYSGQKWLDNGYGNQWKKLLISKWSFQPSNPAGYKMDIQGVNTIIVKGWNIYINADIYNSDDSDSLLVLIATRDEENHGWNIYINQNVTNIDAIIIADGSLLSYNWNKVLIKWWVDDELLRKQLYIYWALSTKNSIGTDEVPYGSDQYVFWWEWTMTDSIYDLSNLRAFQVRYASENPLKECWWDPTLWVPTNVTWSGQVYSWAWKSRCFNNKINVGAGADSVPIVWLRVTDKFNSVVVHYNQRIQLLAPKVLRK